MKIQFDTSAKIAGIGLVPWTRLGPERWFANYKIASLYGWDLGHIEGSPSIVALSDQEGGIPQLERLNSQRLVESEAFQKMATEKLSGYSFLTYKPIDPPQVLLDAGFRFLSMNGRLTRTLENKAEFRTNFSDLGLPFPSYRIIERASLKADDATLTVLLDGHGRVILQDEMLAGGRGTYVIDSVQSLAHALESIERLEGGERVVVSEMVAGANERTVQAVSTRYGVFVGPLQKQIVADPLLANLEVTDGDRFCGGEISASDVHASRYNEIRGYALKIGARLQELGYKGIFGLDCLIGADGKVYVLEINPRITGLTPLLTMLYREGRDIPFYLLHILELAGIDYEITDDTVDDAPPEGSLLVLHCHEPYRTRILSTPPSGAYQLGTMTYKGQSYRLPGQEDGRTMLLQQYMPQGFRGRPGGRLMSAYVNGRVLDDNDQLLLDVTVAVKDIESRISLTRLEDDE